MKLKDAKLVMRPPKILMYGPAGTGKTALAETLGEDAEIIDLDGGAITGMHLDDKFKEDRTNIEYRDCVDDPMRPTAYKKARSYLESFVKNPQCAFLVLDSWTSYTDACINYVMKNQGRPGKAPQLQDWGIIIRELEESLNLIRASRNGVIVIAHRMYTQDEESGDEEKSSVNVGVLCVGRKLPDKFTSVFDEIWYMKTVKTPGGNCDFEIRTVPDPHSIQRSRFNLPAKCRASEGMRKLMEKMGYGVDSKKKQ